jgi:hypothetical protein
MNWDGIVSLLFFSIEAILLVNVLYFSRKNKSLRMGAYVIALLALYQMMEFIICGLEIKICCRIYMPFLFIVISSSCRIIFVLGDS